MTALDPEILVLALICGLLVVPRALQRFRIPAPLTCFAFGIGAGVLAGEFRHDTTLTLLATLGISSLFLFAGLEIDFPGLWRGRGMLLGHLLVRLAVIAGAVWLGMTWLALTWQVATLFVLAVLTPSTGFILDSLESLGLEEKERFWVTNKAVAGELVALAILFGVLQSESAERLAMASGSLALLVAALPLAYLLLGRLVIAHAPGSEFSLLVMVGLVAAYVTKSLGAYYLVGAFLAGLAATMLSRRMPALASHDNQHAVKVFASFFIPFYFFASGMKVPAEALSLKALGVGLALSAAILPGRVAALYLQRRVLMHEPAEASRRVALALTPTLIFTLVLASILRERYGMHDALFGGLLLYAAISTALPSFLLKRGAEFGAINGEAREGGDGVPGKAAAAQGDAPAAAAPPVIPAAQPPGGGA